MAKRGGDKLFSKNKELERKSFERQKENKNKIPDVIVACEDSVSSPTYFRLMVEELIADKVITQDSFVIASHRHTNPSGVLDDLKKHKCDNGKTYKNFDHRWIVIDRDTQRVGGGGHSVQDFNNAVNDAKRLNVEVAYSNDAFELWYLLHFCYRESAILRDEILDEVIKNLKDRNPHKFANLDRDNIKEVKYTKLIFQELLGLQDAAIRNAEKLLDFYGENHNPEQDNPSSAVHKLVKILLELRP